MNRLLLWFFVFLCFSCQPKQQKKTSIKTYFDIESYFVKEINRLQTANPSVLKEAFVKGKKESKSIKIKDWKTEFAIFSNSDINKDSWRGEFKITTKNNVVTYITSNPKIPVKQIEILKDGDTVRTIKIYRLSENYLYRSTDTLAYYPDSLYQIKSNQKLKLLSPKVYQIIGRFSK